MTTTNWATPEAWAQALSNATMASQADGTVLLSSAITNGTDKYLLMDVSGILGSITPGTGGYIEIHVAYLQHDGTSYPDVFAGGPTLVKSALLKTGASIKDFFAEAIQIAPRDFKIGLVLKSGVTTAATGNLLDYSRYNVNNA